MPKTTKIYPLGNEPDAKGKTAYTTYAKISRKRLVCRIALKPMEEAPNDIELPPEGMKYFNFKVLWDLIDSYNGFGYFYPSCKGKGEKSYYDYDNCFDWLLRRNRKIK